MTIRHILLGTSRNPILSLSASLACFTLAVCAQRLANGGFLLGVLGGALLFAIGFSVDAFPKRWFRRFGRWTSYRLLPLVLSVAVAWVGDRMSPINDCPTVVATLLGQVTPLALALASGAQCAVATWLDILRLVATGRRVSLCTVIHHRELVRKKLARGVIVGRKS